MHQRRHFFLTDARATMCSPFPDRRGSGVTHAASAPAQPRIITYLHALNFHAAPAATLCNRQPCGLCGRLANREGM